jgi:hypothetical protein
VLQQELEFRPALLIVRSNVLPARVEVAASDDAPAARGSAGTLLRVPMGSAVDTRRLTVTADTGGVYTGLIRLQAGKPTQVQARLSGGEPG